MPYNATIGSTIIFIAEFVDSNNAVTVPSSATLTVIYPIGVTTVSCVIGMTLNGSVYTASWGSGVSALGTVNYTVAAPGQASIVGEPLRITQ